MVDQYQEVSFQAGVVLAVQGLHRKSYTLINSILNTELHIDGTHHVPPGTSRRSKTRMVSNTSSAAKAAAVAAP